MSQSITTVSRQFFHEVIMPVVERDFPDVAAQTAFGLFGYGSEAYGYDDHYSRDHHWGMRIDSLMPKELFRSHREVVVTNVCANLPSTFRGVSLRAGHLAFLPDRRFFPYDKWILHDFARLPRLVAPLHPLVDEAVRLTTSWERKLELLDSMADILDETMVADGIIQPHNDGRRCARQSLRVLRRFTEEFCSNSRNQMSTAT